MKKNIFKRGASALLAVVMCLTTLVGIGGMTAYAAGTESTAVMIGFPRDGDNNYNGTWGHGYLSFMNGWSASATNYTLVYGVGSYTGNICYCIEPGTPLQTGNNLTSRDENYWDNYPSSYNHTISADDIKLFVGRIMQYGYTGTISTDWRSQNSGGDTLAQARATQLLIWETVVGERDENFNHVSPGGYSAVLDQISTNHPLYSQIMGYYNQIVSDVQNHTKVPSFMAKSTGSAQTVELDWNGSAYTTTMTDTNGVLSNYNFSCSQSDVSFSVSGNQLTITAQTAPADGLRITAEKANSQRKGIITWTDGKYVPGSGVQDLVTYTQSVNDPVKGFVNIKVSFSSAKIVKTSEDGKVDNISFTITGDGVNQTVKTNNSGEMQIDNLLPGVYTVTELAVDKYEPQEVRRVTVVSGQVSTVNFNNVLKRGDLKVIKNSEDKLVEGVTFHLFGTSLSGIAVDEYAVTDSTGTANFKDVLISGSTTYTIEEVDMRKHSFPTASSTPWWAMFLSVTSRLPTNATTRITF